ncbi:MAG: hypothetical protein ACTSQP_13120 [Promethearchaeota archaeon]
MLMQNSNTLIFILWLIIATIIVALVLYLSVKLIESNTKASDKKLMIFLTAFIAVLILPYIIGILNLILSAIGGLLVALRNLFGAGGQNYLVQLTPILFFLILLVLIKVFIDLPWDSAVWITLLTLFVIYILYTLIPELTIIRFG